MEKINKNELIKTQKEWADGLVKMGGLFDQEMERERLAKETVLHLYSFGFSPVFFKPTKARNIPFRTSLEGAVSYFIGGNKDFPEDKGFALEGWQSVHFENVGIIIEDSAAIAMGHYYFSSASMIKNLKVEFTMFYVKDEANRLRISMHHSSLPYEV